MFDLKLQPRFSASQSCSAGGNTDWLIRACVSLSVCVVKQWSCASHPSRCPASILATWAAVRACVIQGVRVNWSWGDFKCFWGQMTTSASNCHPKFMLDGPGSLFLLRPFPSSGPHQHSDSICFSFVTEEESEGATGLRGNVLGR